MVSEGRRRVLTFGFAALAVFPQTGQAWAVERAVAQLDMPMRYLANVADPGIGMAWVEREFDDSAWPAGLYGVGYDKLPDARDLIRVTVADDTASVYTRVEFNVDDAAVISRVLLGADYDDAYAAWINGVEIYRSPEIPAGAPAWNMGTANHESSNGQAPDYDPLIDVTPAALAALRSGVNVLAVGVWNHNTVPSSDLLLVPRLTLYEIDVIERGPYLQRGTPHEVTVRWRTRAFTESRVWFGTDPANLDRTVADPEPVVDHEVVVTGLEPDTRYYYAVGNDLAILAGRDADHTFVTAPADGTPKPTRIWVLGDSGLGNSAARAVRDAYLARTDAEQKETDLWLMLGDNAYPDGTDADHQRGVFEVYAQTLRTSVLWPTLGNHDAVSADSVTGTGPYYDIFTMPAAGEAGGLPSGTEAYYSFDYANIHFVVLDSQEMSRLPNAPMLTWLAQDLAATQQDWIVAYWHHPPYSRGSHDSDLELPQIQMRENALPILEDHGVDLVLTGHSHSYERSFLIDGYYGSSADWSESWKRDPGDGGGDAAYRKSALGGVPHEGTVYAVAGSSSQISGGPLDHPAMVYSFNILGSLILDVEFHRLRARFLGSGGNVLDDFTIIKGDETLPPTAQFVADPHAGPAPLTVRFGDRSSGVPLQWTWDFDDDGTTDSSVRNPVRVYPEPGLYSVRLTTSNTSGSDDELKPDLICVTAVAPPLIESLWFLDSVVLQWAPSAGGSSYDLIKGDLVALRAAQGDFSQVPLQCIADDGQDTSAEDPARPRLPGEGSFYLVRSVDCAGQAGSYEGPGTGGTRERDARLQPGVAVGACDCRPTDDPDGDGICGRFDNCAGVADTDQTDQDADGLGDACDSCPLDAADDADDDGVCGDQDNCAQIANPGQADADDDGRGDACDPCVFDAADDADADGLCGDVDNCPDVPNAEQLDQDLDGIGNDCDACPRDPNNDFDLDGVCANADNCPVTANPAQEDADGDAIGDACDICPADPDNDADQDFICGDQDNCPLTFNFDQVDLDGDGAGDACDPDDDGDGSDDAVDCAPQWAGLSAIPEPVGPTLRLSGPNGPNGSMLRWLRGYQGHVSNVYRDVQVVGQPTVPDPACIAAELPGTSMVEATLPAAGRLLRYLVSGRNSCGESALGAPTGGQSVPPQVLCAPQHNDTDGDQVADLRDNCALVPNAAQVDVDFDFVGDACDNCPDTPNPDQLDTDQDGTGDACAGSTR